MTSGKECLGKGEVRNLYAQKCNARGDFGNIKGETDKNRLSNQVGLMIN